MQTKSSYDFVLQSFESYSDYIDYTLKERTSRTTFSFGFGIPGVAEFGFNFDDSRYSKSVKKIRRASGTVRFFFFLYVFPSWHLNALISFRMKIAVAICQYILLMHNLELGSAKINSTFTSFSREKTEQEPCHHSRSSYSYAALNVVLFTNDVFSADHEFCTIDCFYCGSPHICSTELWIMYLLAVQK